jgi:hypothetical protein
MPSYARPNKFAEHESKTMVVQIHGFDWEIYVEQVMPAFAELLLENDERALLALFEKTRCAYEEQFLPDPMQRLRVWPRAHAFIQTLPHGPYSRREYQKLCSPIQYTALSDRYLYRHPPQLYQHSNALRSVWGAIIESYCLPWTSTSSPARHIDLSGLTNHGEPAPALADQQRTALSSSLRLVASGESISRGELAALLTDAGLPELAREVEAQSGLLEYHAWEIGENAGEQEQEREQEQAEQPGNTGNTTAAGESYAATSLDEQIPALPDEIEEETVIAAQGVFIGQVSNLLHLRGWLAGISVRAMALFEYLACGRRSMPFGFEAGEPFGAFAGYLTPDEVWQLAACLENVIPPDHEAAQEDYLNFRYQHYGIPPAFRLIDEVLPAHAADFLFAVRKASAQGSGLISSME